MKVGGRQTPRLRSFHTIERSIRRLELHLGAIGGIVAPPVLRLALAVPFFKSGLTRWDGFLSLSPGTAFLFRNMFKLHILGLSYPFPAPIVIAYAVGTAEILLPVFLALGLGTCFAAFGLLVMTAIIQLVAPEGWANFHLPWASMALAIIALGPGPLSLDHLICTLGRWRNGLAKG